MCSTFKIRKRQKIDHILVKIYKKKISIDKKKVWNQNIKFDLKKNINY